ncbi:10859_t:CDS:2 [Cetraspora pellucida]|uniref:10859_t:CDS:1 n=1 Tax=Cetraspora pellucida TaxID=1433469 RepID=A0A9N9E9J5_9GLOM|nr:10859_t:CDS:2 [Cetraspora pellucida]
MPSQDDQAKKFSICNVCLTNQDNQLKKTPDFEAKKTRLYVKQACTNCRAKKEKCSGGDRCTNCVRRNKECTYVSSGKKRGPKPKEPLRPTYH